MNIGGQKVGWQAEGGRRVLSGESKGLGGVKVSVGQGVEARWFKSSGECVLAWLDLGWRSKLSHRGGPFAVEWV